MDTSSVEEKSESKGKYKYKLKRNNNDVKKLSREIDIEKLDSIKAELQVCRNNKYQIRKAIEKCDGNIEKVEKSLTLLDKKVAKTKGNLSKEDLNKVNAKKKEMLLLLRKYTLYNEKCKEKLDVEIQNMILVNDRYLQTLNFEKHKNSIQQRVYIPEKDDKIRNKKVVDADDGTTKYIYNRLILKQTDKSIKVHTGEELLKMCAEHKNLQEKLGYYDLENLLEYEIRGLHLNIDKLASDLCLDVPNTKPRTVLYYIRNNYKHLLDNYNKNTNNPIATDRFLCQIFRAFKLEKAFELYNISNNFKPTFCATSRYILSDSDNIAHALSLEHFKYRDFLISHYNLIEANLKYIKYRNYAKPGLRVINSCDNNNYVTFMYNGSIAYIPVSPDAVNDKGEVPLYDIYFELSKAEEKKAKKIAEEKKKKSIDQKNYVYETLTLNPINNIKDIKVRTGEDILKKCNKYKFYKKKLKHYDLENLLEYEIRGFTVNIDKLASDLSLNLSSHDSKSILNYIKENYKNKDLIEKYNKNTNNPRATDKFLSTIFKMFNIDDAFDLYNISRDSKPMFCATSRYIISFSNYTPYVMSLDFVECRQLLTSKRPIEGTETDNIKYLNYNNKYTKPCLKVLNSCDNEYYLTTLWNNRIVYIPTSPDAVSDNSRVKIYELYFEEDASDNKIDGEDKIEVKVNDEPTDDVLEEANLEEEAEVVVEEVLADEQVELEVLPEVKKKRGRPRKVKTEEETELKEEVPSEEKVEEEPVPEVKKKRGRPRKVKVEE